ncbi:hypothetical protein WN55_07471 [Dufourea novaeangliae]|uniref:Uncharacterized protein n=1 Tax=Dufourea novaeangliae TaxID=178035 RepID=A0A154PS40_DUFNO|nr:hypothetical protein WN55_07471 [Dufourea novaeangliae]
MYRGSRLVVERRGRGREVEVAALRRRKVAERRNRGFSLDDERQQSCRGSEVRDKGEGGSKVGASTAGGGEIASEKEEVEGNVQGRKRCRRAGETKAKSRVPPTPPSPQPRGQRRRDQWTCAGVPRHHGDLLATSRNKMATAPPNLAERWRQDHVPPDRLWNR